MPKKEIISITHQIATPKLWWPNGCGAQALCDLRVAVVSSSGGASGSGGAGSGSASGSGGTKSLGGDRNAWEGKVGLRHLQLDTGKDVSFRSSYCLFYFYFFFLGFLLT